MEKNYYYIIKILNNNKNYKKKSNLCNFVVGVWNFLFYYEKRRRKTKRIKWEESLALQPKKTNHNYLNNLNFFFSTKLLIKLQKLFESEQKKTKKAYVFMMFQIVITLSHGQGHSLKVLHHYNCIRMCTKRLFYLNPIFGLL